MITDLPSDNYDVVEPDPSALLESLRAFGYSPETAIADLVDNSITAGASIVDVLFNWDGRDSSVTLIDNGSGMSGDDLTRAMRPGSQSPTELRSKNDLGRFGLGLKTASFSQCRSLTVVSFSPSDEAHGRRWDLDEVRASRQWRLLRVSPSVTPTESKILRGAESWTIIRWAKCDRICGDVDSNNATAQREFYEMADRVVVHLSMTFHRFIGSTFRIRVNGSEVPRWDPFLRGNLATQDLGETRLAFQDEEVSVHAFVLPHRSKLTDSEFMLAGGPDGWNALQGFYVYRNKRLLLAGDWLGLRMTKEEHYKLARIQIDIPNSTDDAWQIDVRKSIAVPPPELKETLKNIARVTRQRAVSVYRHRGKVLTPGGRAGISFVWSQRATGGKIHYEINRDHPVVEDALNHPTTKNVRNLLTVIEETIPVPLIAINSSEGTEEHGGPLSGVTDRQVVELATACYRSLRLKGLDEVEAIDRILTMDPFHLYPQLAADLAALESGELHE